jgi:CubicO group peptidase (beta-lactamase class C family)
MEMKKILNTKTWLLAGAALLLLAGLVVLAWSLIPGLHAIPSATDYRPTGAPTTMPINEFWPTNGWRTSAPEEQGLDSIKLAEGLQSLQEKQVGIDSLLIIRNGYVLLNAHFYPYDGSFPHNLASVTKSFTTTLIAIAAAQGKLQLDQPMVGYFPDRTIANLDDFKKSITVRHLAGMVNGMKSGCLNGDEPTLDDMRSQPDWVQAALDRKMTNAPGTQFCYDSPGMHILSAILQETSGMTELEFARKNLFDPLGIRDVTWEADPQGYSHGWGDLPLLPEDAAKLGYLWLHNGIWEGRQVVPADWVADAVKVHMRTGRTDNYGYGWWVSDDSYSAMGRGGQNVKVYPALNAIVVTTGSDFDYSQLDPILEAAFVSPEKPLPPNPQGAASLNALLAGLTQGPGLQPATSLPETAKGVSGKTYTCDSNPTGISALRFVFNDLNTAEMYMQRYGRETIWPIGMDGKYRMAPEGPTLGYWEDTQTFIIQIFDIGTRTRKLQFAGDSLQVDIPEDGIRLECQVQNP